MLKEIENVSGHETFTLDGETLTWQADGGSIIYQGTSDKLPDIMPHATAARMPRRRKSKTRRAL